MRATTSILILLLVARAGGAADVRSIRSTTIAGQPHTLLDESAKATVVIFLNTDCPIANRSIVKLNFLSRSFGKWKTPLVAVISDPRVSRRGAADWAKERGVTFPVLFDASGEIADALKPTHTPHAFVVKRDGTIVYDGRIDDANPTIGRERHDATSYDLAAAVTDVSHDRPVQTPHTEPVGCVFESWDQYRAATKDKDARPRFTFARDVAPIVYSNCVSCHRAGEVAPFPLDSYEQVSKRARMIAAVTKDRFMPPWKPVAEGSARFTGERRLSDREIEILSQWATDGAPRGDDADLPTPPTFPSGWRLGEPDIVLKMPQPFTVRAAGADVYRAFVLPIDLPEDAWVSAVDFRPGAGSVVHHAIFFLDTTGAARMRDEADPLPGYESFGGPGFLPSGALGGWAPGSFAERLPDGVGRKLPANADLVLQVHYHPDGIERQDQSTVAIYLSKKPVDRRVATIALVNRDIDIAPGDANDIRTADFTLPAETTLISLRPHMHLLGREMKVWAELPGGETKPLVEIRDWQFRWQDQYRLAEPMTLPAGTVLRMRARFDNSKDNPDNPANPPVRVTRGEQTTDEMCLCFVEYLAANETDVRTMRRAMILQRIADRFR